MGKGICQGCGWEEKLNENGFCVYCQDLIDFGESLKEIDEEYHEEHRGT